MLMFEVKIEELPNSSRIAIVNWQAVPAVAIVKQFPDATLETAWGVAGKTKTSKPSPLDPSNGKIWGIMFRYEEL